jgi:cellobiose-specific phosphotransferase system component IIB
MEKTTYLLISLVALSSIWYMIQPDPLIIFCLFISLGGLVVDTVILSSQLKFSKKELIKIQDKLNVDLNTINQAYKRQQQELIDIQNVLNLNNNTKQL